MEEISRRKSSFNDLPSDVKEIILEMTYQLGVTGVLKFKKMWKALEQNDYEEASAQMLDSLWAKQTPARAIRLAERMRELAK